MKKEYKVGDIYKWQGFRNSAGIINSGYLYIATKVKNGEVIEGSGVKITDVKNRSEAIKKYLLNPDNPNNRKYL